MFHFFNVIYLNQYSNGVEIDKATIVEVWKDWEGQRSNDTLGTDFFLFSKSTFALLIYSDRNVEYAFMNEIGIANVTGSGYRAILAAPWYLNYNSYG